MTATRPPVGFVGLGIMGLPMARHAAAAGFPVLAWNRGEARRAAARAAGLSLAATPREVAAASEAIVVMVTDPGALDAVLSGPDGILAAAPRGRTLVQSSTVDEAATISAAGRARAAGMDVLDAPVAGSKPLVEKGQVIVLAGGEEAVLERWRPLLLSWGKAIVHAGPVGKGTALKLSMNLLVAQLTTGLAEAVAFARARGVAPERVFDVLDVSPALGCGYFAAKKGALLRGDYSPQFSLANLLKDMRFVEEAAAASGARLPVTRAARLLLEAAAAAGHSAEDVAAVSKAL